MLIDTHCHINFDDYKNDADQVIRQALDNDIWLILSGTDIKSSNRALSLANKYEKGVYVAVGLHPSNLHDQTFEEKDSEGKIKQISKIKAQDFDFGVYEKLAKFEKVVAIGEIGLDYYRLDPGQDKNKQKKKQQEVFAAQLFLARSLYLPVIIHCRQAHDDLLTMLQDFKAEYGHLLPTDKPWGVLHCFSGDEDLAWKYFKLGLIISFTGLITFSSNWDEMIRKIPLDKIMVETDSPYMTPEPYRGERNEPFLVQYVAKRIADIRGIKLEKVAERTTETAKQLFNI